MNYFTDPDTWFGGFYELAIELGPVSEREVYTVLDAIWKYPLLQGCYLERNLEPEAQPRLTMAPKLLRKGHLQGLAGLPNQQQVGCGTCVVRQSDRVKWVILYLPLGALGSIYPVGGYPFGDEDTIEAWQPAIDSWHEALGRYIFNQCHFKLALIGFEVSGLTDADTLAKTGIPEERYIGYLWNHHDQLEYWPRNKP